MVLIYTVLLEKSVGNRLEKKMHKYRNVDVEEYERFPSHVKKMDKITGTEAIPVGPYGEYVCQDKNDPNNLKKSQYNIRDRFGHLTDEDLQDY